MVLTIPPNGQTAGFLREIPGFTDLPAALQGVLRIFAGTPIAVTSLRGHTNERGEFLITATPPVDESAPAGASELFFPQFAEGAGYSMQFIFFGRPSSGTMYLIHQSGDPAALLFR